MLLFLPPLLGLEFLRGQGARRGNRSRRGERGRRWRSDALVNDGVVPAFYDRPFEHLKFLFQLFLTRLIRRLLRGDRQCEKWIVQP